MAQLVARLHGMQEVRGSNPLSSTKFKLFILETELSDLGRVMLLCVKNDRSEKLHS